MSPSLKSTNYSHSQWWSDRSNRRDPPTRSPTSFLLIGIGFWLFFIVYPSTVVPQEMQCRSLLLVSSPHKSCHHRGDIFVLGFKTSPSPPGGSQAKETKRFHSIVSSTEMVQCHSTDLELLERQLTGPLRQNDCCHVQRNGICGLSWRKCGVLVA